MVHLGHIAVLKVIRHLSTIINAACVLFRCGILIRSGILRLRRIFTLWNDSRIVSIWIDRSWVSAEGFPKRGP